MTARPVQGRRPARQSRAGRSIGRSARICATLSWLATAAGLVTGNDLIVDPAFPECETGRLRRRSCAGSISLAAGIEPLLPLDWLPKQVTLTNTSGVHAEKTGGVRDPWRCWSLCYRLPEMSRQPASQARWQQIFTPSIAGKTVLIRWGWARWVGPRQNRPRSSA